MLQGVEHLIVVPGSEIWEDNDEGRRDGGVFVDIEKEEEVVRWQKDALEGWRAVKTAGLGDEVKLSMLG